MSLDSWTQAITNYLMNVDVPGTGVTASNVCEHAAMIGDDGTPWAATPGFSLQSYSLTVDSADGGTRSARIDELSRLRLAFQHRSGPEDGLRLNREKYFLIHHYVDKNILYLKKTGGGACIARSGQCFIISTYSDGKVMTKRGSEEMSPQDFGMVIRGCVRLQGLLLENGL